MANKNYIILRRAALAALGDRCSRCGFDDQRALQIDHINDDGHEQRKAAGGSYGLRIVRLVLAGAHGYQLLCANCNWIKRHERSAPDVRAEAA